MKKIAITSLVFLVAGCAHEVPMGVAFQKPEQLKLNSASHWEVMAHNEAGRIVKALKNSAGLPVFIKLPAKASPFAAAYHHLLVSNLVAQGVTVVTQPASNSAELSYNVDVIKHPTNYTEQMGFMTPLAQGVYHLATTSLAQGVHDITSSAIELAKSPFYAAIDQVKPNLATPTEVLITTQVTVGNLVLSSNSSAYYIENANLSQYSYREPDRGPHQFTVSNQP